MPSLADHQAKMRAEFPDMRVYNWREIEDMRNSLASVAMAASRARARDINLEPRVEELAAIIEELRAEGLYRFSDRLRPLLKALRSPYGR